MGQPVPFHGVVDNTLHAFRLALAADRGLVPRIIRRLSQAEHTRMAKSGAVIIFNVQESGIHRWRDGLLWTPSRIEGNFLVYKEMSVDARPDGVAPARSPNLITKLNGLHKRTITVKLRHCEYHVISYYTSEEMKSGQLKRVTTRPDIMDLELHASLFDLSGYRVPPQTQLDDILREGEDEPIPVYAASLEPSLSSDYPASNSISGVAESSNACAYSSDALETYQQHLDSTHPSQSIHHPQPMRHPWSSPPPTEDQTAIRGFSPVHSLTDASTLSNNLQHVSRMHLAYSKQCADSMPASFYQHIETLRRRPSLEGSPRYPY
ncbi:hypothetical protein FIBSPDRAFT_791704 [Athelia psychrophila]|uniref:Gti1/Pac2 family-domain-containing protein n=1 Tax=Athelia psychrophila TaxID=1759441 RepID=A0A166H6V1_9AGAM|nr:hypothetical protein FIBSPDRAFT_791704 [Fibularhizoctonia sp. CBS 109695]